MLAGTKKLMGKAYEDFCDAMITAGEDDALPITLKLEDTFGVTCQDIADLCKDFERDTALQLTAQMFICRDCGRLHMVIEVNYLDDEEEDNKLLQ